MTAGALPFGVGCIALSDAPGTPSLGDRRTLADLSADTTKPVGAVDGKQERKAARAPHRLREAPT